MPSTSDFEKIESNSSQSRGKNTRSSLSRLSSNSASKSVEMAPKRRKSEGKKKPTEKEEEENRDLVERISRVKTTDESATPQAKEAPAKKRNRKVYHPAAEVFSQKVYRQVASGYDLDGDSDTDVPGTSQQAVITDNWKPEYSEGTQELARPDAIPRPEIRENDFFLDEKLGFIVPGKLITCDSEAPYFDARFHTPGVSKEPLHYEITAQDVVFIEKLNLSRKLVSHDEYMTIPLFTSIIKALEIEAFKRIHDHLLDTLHVVYTRPPDDEGEDAECDVCRIPECDEHDEMVFCDMCNTCVHMSCAGIAELPEKNEPWKCEKCSKTGNPAPQCILCPALGGSMTWSPDKHAWAHHSCALFMPEIIFENEERRAPMTQIERIPPERWSQLCAVCDTSIGACITCSWPGCEETHHVCCALRAGLTVKIQEIPNDPDQNVRRVTYCHRHTPEILIEEKYQQYRNPWLARLESVFYLMTDYEKVAELLQIEEIVVSDVYEYWKQRRLSESCRPLITHLRDHTPVKPTIERVAEKAADNLAAKMANFASKNAKNPGKNAYKISGNAQLDTFSFFRPATLMVTELRQLRLKRVAAGLTADLKMAELVQNRELLKRRKIEAEIQEIRIFQQFLHQKTPKIARFTPKNEGFLAKITVEWTKSCGKPENFEKFAEQLEEFKKRGELRIDVGSVGNSPLRPRNWALQSPGKSRKSTTIVSPGSTQNLGPATTKSIRRKAHCSSSTTVPLAPPTFSSPPRPSMTSSEHKEPQDDGEKS